MIKVNLSKADTLDLLESNGFNTVDRRVLRKPFTLAKIKKALESIWHVKISVRTWKSDLNLCPFYPNQRRATLYNLMEREWPHIKDMDEIIFSEGIDPSDSCRAGKISHLTHNNNIVIEYFMGAGTVRKLDRMKSDEVTRFILSPSQVFSVIEERDMRYLTAQAVNFFSKYSGTTIEWSQYPYLIGKKKRTIIFWEVLF